nr:alpha/beta hydrolase [Pseudoruegeria sp. HB172150]
MTVPPARQPGTIPSFRRDVRPDEQFIVGNHATLAGAAGFRAALAAELAESPAGRREAIIYVHGFNNTFDEGVLRLAQLADDFGFEGSAIHYSWPSAGQVFGYVYDRDSVLFARDGLDNLITDIKRAGADTIILVAHSVGSHLVMETLRQRDIAHPGSVARDLAGVMLISPDIDVSLFRSQAKRIEKLPDPFGIFVSDRDRALRLSARLTGQKDRLGSASAQEVADLNVTLVDVTEFSEGTGHFTTAESPALISMFNNAGNLEAAFQGDSAGRAGLLPGTILTVQEATEIILSPAELLLSPDGAFE